MRDYCSGYETSDRLVRQRSEVAKEPSQKIAQSGYSMQSGIVQICVTVSIFEEFLTSID